MTDIARTRSVDSGEWNWGDIGLAINSASASAENYAAKHFTEQRVRDIERGCVTSNEVT